MFHPNRVSLAALSESVPMQSTSILSWPLFSRWRENRWAMREKKKEEGKPKGTHPITTKCKNFNVALLWDESTVRQMPQSRNVTHRIQEEGQTGPENSVYPNILSSFLCFVMGRWAYALGVGQEIRHLMMDGKRSPEMSLHSQHKVFSSPQICINSEQNSENRARVDALFWILMLTVFMSNHSSQSEREMKQRMTERHFL